MTYGESRVSIEVHEFLTLIRTLEQQVAQLTQELEATKGRADSAERQAALWYAWAGSPRDERKTIGRHPETRFAPEVEYGAHSADPKVQNDWYLQTGKPDDSGAKQEER